MGEAKRAQGAVEYIILLAILLVILLFLLGLLGFFPGGSIDARMGQSQSYWQGSASPLKILDWNMATSSCSSPTTIDSKLSLVVQNPTRSPITIRSITITPGKFTYIFYLGGNYAGKSDALSIRLNPGEKTSIIAEHYDTGSSAYVPPAYPELSVTFKYDSDIPSSVQTGTLPVITINKDTGPSGCTPGAACPADAPSCGGSCCAGTCTNGLCVLPNQNICGDVVCPAGQYCVNGACASACLPPNSLCGTSGNCCDATQLCQAGSCISAAACTAPSFACGTSCCSAGQLCQNNACVAAASCQAPSFTCGNSCCTSTQRCDTSTNPNTCSSTCAVGETPCTNAANCCASGKVCDTSGQTPVCADTCPPGSTKCGSICYPDNACPVCLDGNCCTGTACYSTFTAEYGCTHLVGGVEKAGCAPGQLCDQSSNTCLGGCPQGTTSCGNSVCCTAGNTCDASGGPACVATTGGSCCTAGLTCANTTGSCCAAGSLCNTSITSGQTTNACCGSDPCLTYAGTSFNVCCTNQGTTYNYSDGTNQHQYSKSGTCGGTGGSPGICCPDGQSCTGGAGQPTCCANDKLCLAGKYGQSLNWTCCSGTDGCAADANGATACCSAARQCMINGTNTCCPSNSACLGTDSGSICCKNAPDGAVCNLLNGSTQCCDTTAAGGETCFPAAGCCKPANHQVGACQGGAPYDLCCPGGSVDCSDPQNPVCGTCESSGRQTCTPDLCCPSGTCVTIPPVNQPPAGLCCNTQGTKNQNTQQYENKSTVCGSAGSLSCCPYPLAVLPPSSYGKPAGTCTQCCPANNVACLTANNTVGKDAGTDGTGSDFSCCLNGQCQSTGASTSHDASQLCCGQGSVCGPLTDPSVNNPAGYTCCQGSCADGATVSGTKQCCAVNQISCNHGDGKGECCPTGSICGYHDPVVTSSLCCTPPNTVGHNSIGANVCCAPEGTPGSTMTACQGTSLCCGPGTHCSPNGQICMPG